MTSVLFVWHAAILATNQKYLFHLASDPDLAVTLLIPPRWDESTSMEEAHIPPAFSNFRVLVDEVKKPCKGLSYRFCNLRTILAELRPDIIFLYEEPYSYVALQMMYWKRRICPQAKFVFFTWQNLDCRYSFLRRQSESYVFRHSDMAVAGSKDVDDVLRLHGFCREIRRIPLALDPHYFLPVTEPARSDLRVRMGLQAFTVGYIGRLAKAKGLEDLLVAVSRIRQQPWQLLLIGSGPDEAMLRNLAQTLGIGERIVWIPYVKNIEMYQYYSIMDAFVLPSRTTKDWKEQFGRVLIEAMICGIPVVGSSSGEIPLVLENAGLVFPEGDCNELSSALLRLMNDGGLREQLIRTGRERVLAHYTWEHVGQNTARLIKMLACR